MNCKLMHGDCLEEMDKLIERGIKVDAIITDLPYGVTNCKWDTVIPFDEMWKRLKLLRKDRTPIVLFGSEPFSSALRMSNINEYKYDWIWKKNNVTGMMQAKRQPLKKYEIISVFYNKQPVYNRQMIKRTPEEYKISYRKNDSIPNKSGHYVSKKIRQSKERQWYKPPVNILEYKRDAKRTGKSHPTQKPVLLLEYLNKTYTNENDTVLDFTMGSGTTGVACKNLNRKFIGIEKELKYYKIACERIKSCNNDLFNAVGW